MNQLAENPVENSVRPDANAANPEKNPMRVGNNGGLLRTGGRHSGGKPGRSGRRPSRIYELARRGFEQALPVLVTAAVRGFEEFTLPGPAGEPIISRRPVSFAERLRAADLLWKASGLERLLLTSPPEEPVTFSLDLGSRLDDVLDRLARRQVEPMAAEIIEEPAALPPASAESPQDASISREEPVGAAIAAEPSPETPTEPVTVTRLGAGGYWKLTPSCGEMFCVGDPPVGAARWGDD